MTKEVPSVGVSRIFGGGNNNDNINMLQWSTDNRWIDIPCFQRGYVWNEPSATSNYQYQESSFDAKPPTSLDKFLDYLGFLLTRGSGLCGNGVLFLEKKDSREGKAENDSYEVIDGQQRITTFFILFVCVHNLLVEDLVKNKNSYGHGESHYYTTESIAKLIGRRMDNSGICLGKLRHKDVHVFRFSEDGMWVINENNSAVAVDAEYIKEVREAKNTVDLWVRKWINEQYKGKSLKEQVAQFLESLGNIFFALTITHDAETAAEMFDSINMQGVPLGKVDLLRNDIFGIGKNYNYKKGVEFVNEWDGFTKEISEISGSTANVEKSVMRFLQYYLNALGGRGIKIDSQKPIRIYSEFRKKSGKILRFRSIILMKR